MSDDCSKCEATREQAWRSLTDAADTDGELRDVITVLAGWFHEVGGRCHECPVALTDVRCVGKCEPAVIEAAFKHVRKGKT